MDNNSLVNSPQDLKRTADQALLPADSILSLSFKDYNKFAETKEKFTKELQEEYGISKTGSETLINHGITRPEHLTCLTQQCMDELDSYDMTQVFKFIEYKAKYELALEDRKVKMTAEAKEKARTTEANLKMLSQRTLTLPVFSGKETEFRKYFISFTRYLKDKGYDKEGAWFAELKMSLPVSTQEKLNREIDPMYLADSAPKFDILKNWDQVKEKIKEIIRPFGYVAKLTHHLNNMEVQREDTLKEVFDRYIEVLAELKEMNEQKDSLIWPNKIYRLFPRPIQMIILTLLALKQKKVYSTLTKMSEVLRAFSEEDYADRKIHKYHSDEHVERKEKREFPECHTCKETTHLRKDCPLKKKQIETLGKDTKKVGLYCTICKRTNHKVEDCGDTKAKQAMLDLVNFANKRAQQRRSGTTTF
jgi:hypothetical protein